MRSSLSLFVLVIAACAARAAPCPPGPATAGPAAAVAAEPPLPAEDDQLRRWQAIHAGGDHVPAGTTAAALLPELIAYLGSPDPARRDGIAYEVLVAWIVREPVLSPAELRALATELRGNLRAAPGGPDDVFRRSFSALALSLIAKRDLDLPVLTVDERRGLLADAAAYAARETDLRGYTGARGWAHAAAHTADLLKFLARQPGFDAADRAVVLDAVAALAVRRHGANFHHGEDSRLVAPVMEAIRRGVEPARFERWLATIAAPLMEAGTAEFDGALYAAQRNAHRLLTTLFMNLAIEPEPSPGVRQALDALRALLAA